MNNTRDCNCLGPLLTKQHQWPNITISCTNQSLSALCCTQWFVVLISVWTWGMFAVYLCSHFLLAFCQYHQGSPGPDPTAQKGGGKRCSDVKHPLICSWILFAYRTAWHELACFNAFIVLPLKSKGVLPFPVQLGPNNPHSPAIPPVIFH